MDPGTPLSTDLPCHQCRYNLRGLPSDSRCPECGEPIANTRAATNPAIDLRLSHWFNQLALGALLLAAASVASCFVPASVQKNKTFPVSGYRFNVLSGWLAVGGICLLSSRKPRSVVGSSRITYSRATTILRTLRVISRPGNRPFADVLVVLALITVIWPNLVLAGDLGFDIFSIGSAGLLVLLLSMAAALAVFPTTILFHLRLWKLSRDLPSLCLQFQVAVYVVLSTITMARSGVMALVNPPFPIAGIGEVGQTRLLFSTLRAAPPFGFQGNWLAALLPIWAFCLFLFAAFRFHRAARQGAACASRS